MRRTISVVVALAVSVVVVGCWPVYGPAWSPDGTKVLYPYLVDTDTYGLALHDRTTGKTRGVYELGKGSGIYWLGWKPDGTAAVAITVGGPEGPSVLVLDATSWHLIRRIPVPPTAVNEVAIVGHYLVATIAIDSNKGKIIRLDLRNGEFVERTAGADRILAVGQDLYFLNEPSSGGTNEGYVFGRIDADTLESSADFTIPAAPRDAISGVAVDGDRIAIVTHEKNAEDGATLRLYENRRLARSIPLDDIGVPLLVAPRWSGQTLRAIVVSQLKRRELPSGPEETYFDLVPCEFHLETGFDSCKKARSLQSPFVEDPLPELGMFGLNLFLISESPDGRWLALAQEKLKLVETEQPDGEALEIASPSSTYTLPAVYESLGRGVLLSGFESGSEMLRLERARSFLLRDLNKLGVAVANAEAGIEPLIVGDLRLPLLAEEVGKLRRNSLLHLTVDSHSMRLECFDPSGTPRWTEEVTGRKSVRRLWKPMHKRLSQHADEACVEATEERPAGYPTP